MGKERPERRHCPPLLVKTVGEEGHFRVSKDLVGDLSRNTKKEEEKEC